jgi:hypothetical protein
MNRREASDWVHLQSVTADVAFDDLVAAFTALKGHVPSSADHRHGLFRSCLEVVVPSMGVTYTPAKGRSY